MTCTRTTAEVDERIDAVILALDGCGWMTQRELIEKMGRMSLVMPYQTVHLPYTLQKMRLKGLVECHRTRGGLAYEYCLAS